MRIKCKEVVYEEKLLSEIEKDIDWYDKKSGNNKKLYRVLSLIQLVLTALIPAINTFNQIKGKEIITIISMLLVIVTGVMKLYKPEENWMLYRYTAERLKSEKRMFTSRSGIYSAGKNKLMDIFVERVNKIIYSENIEWTKKLESRVDFSKDKT